MTQEIIYVLPHKLQDSRFSSLLAKNPQHNWANYFKINQVMGPNISWYSRTGKNTLPLKDSAAQVNSLNMTPPVYDPTFDMTFEEVTDLRCQQLMKSCNDAPWAVQWSGGLDSTLVMAAIIKNFSPSDYSRVRVVCNHYSIYENPQFYFKYIEPNFEVINSTYSNPAEDFCRDYYVITGDPGDNCLYSYINANGHIAETVLPQGLDIRFDIERDVRRDPDGVIDLLSRLADKNFAKWFYNCVMENIESVDVPVITYHDFFWWIQFNYSWLGVKTLFYTRQSAVNLDATIPFDRYVPFNDTAEYQQWAMNNNVRGQKYGKDIGEYKLATKKYIYSVDNDEYYYRFKMKTNSLSRSVNRSAPTWFCLLNDFTVLHIEKDLEQILSLLQQHIEP